MCELSTFLECTDHMELLFPLVNHKIQIHMFEIDLFGFIKVVVPLQISVK